MKMLSAILNVFDNHPLVVKHFVAVFFLTTLNNGQNLLVGQKLALHGVDADMMQRLGAFRAAGDFPHLLEGIIKVSGFGVAQFDEACFLVLALLLHILGGGSVSAPNVRFYDHSASMPSVSARRTAR